MDLEARFSTVREPVMTIVCARSMLEGMAVALSDEPGFNSTLLKLTGKNCGSSVFDVLVTSCVVAPQFAEFTSAKFTGLHEFPEHFNAVIFAYE